MTNIAVYTAIFGKRDTLHGPHIRIPHADYICFTDQCFSVPGWEVRTCSDVCGDPRRTARMYKVLSHRFLSQYRYSLWIDGSFSPSVDPHTLIDMYLQSVDMASFAHPNRNCAYQEAQECMRRSRDHPDTISSQMRAYYARGYPFRNGLAATGLLLRRHTAEIRQFNEAWWQEIVTHSSRDQLSFDYCIHKLAPPYRTIPGHIYVNPYILWHGHRPYAQSGASIGADTKRYHRLLSLMQS